MCFYVRLCVVAVANILNLSVLAYSVHFVFFSLAETTQHLDFSSTLGTELFAKYKFLCFCE